MVAPNGQVIKGVSADRAMAAAAGGSPQAAAAARLNTATTVNRFLNSFYGGMWSGAPTNASVMSVATTESNNYKKANNGKNKQDNAKSTFASSASTTMMMRLQKIMLD